MSPLLDVLITLLQWGADGWSKVLQQREEVYRWRIGLYQAVLLLPCPHKAVFDFFRRSIQVVANVSNAVILSPEALSLSCSPAGRYALQQLGSFAQTVGERALYTPGNPISIGMTFGHSSKAVPCPPNGIHQGQASAQDKGHGRSHSKPGGEATHSSRTRDVNILAAPSHPAVLPGHDRAEVEDGQGAMPGIVASSSPELGARASGVAAGSSPRGLPTQAGHEVQGRSAPLQPLSMLGAMLFKRGVSGTRVVAQGKVQSIAGHSFQGYGAHHDSYPHTYLTFAATLGTTKQDVDAFLERLRVCLDEFRRTE